jgi:hypothetical protein
MKCSDDRQSPVRLRKLCAYGFVSLFGDEEESEKPLAASAKNLCTAVKRRRFTHGGVVFVVV